MIDVATLRAMAAAGASVDVILAAVEAAQNSEAEKLAAKRDKDAARQRRHRTARTCHAESQPVTRTACDTPPVHIEITPPLREKPKKVSLSIDAADVPTSSTDEARGFASEKGWDRAKTDLEWQRFRDHGLTKGRKHRNLLAAWRNWVTSPFQTSSSKGPAHVAENRSLVAAARRAAERFSGAPELGDQPGEPVLRLISESRR